MSAGEAMTQKTSWEDELYALFAQRFGHQVPAREVERIERAIMGSHAPGELDAYFTLLRTLPLESPIMQALIDRGMNNESYFFRDAPTMDTLRNEIMPELLERAAGSRVFRVWSAGCSSGEELYTISILLHELVDDLDDWSIALIGTDIDADALAAARNAEYREWSLRATPEDVRCRYFEPSGGGRYRLRERYRRNTSFALHNLAEPAAPVPAPSCFDLVLCRNVSIYFTPDAREALARTLVGALARDGVWIAGPSDARPSAGVATRTLPGVIEHRRLDGPSVRENSAAPAHVCWTLPSSKPPPAPKAATPALPIMRRVLRTARRAQEPERAEPAPHTRRLRDKLSEARGLADRGALQPARALVGEVIATDPMLADAHLLHALLAESAGETGQAVDALRRALYLDPRSIEAHVRLGVLLDSMGDREAAAVSLRNAAGLSEAVSAGTDDGGLRQFAAWYMTNLLSERIDE